MATSDFDFFEALGKGSAGDVYKVRKKSTKVQYAIKIMPKRKLLQSFGDICELVTSEVTILAAVRHPFIISMDYSFQNSQYAFIAMELAEGGNLRGIPAMLKQAVLTESQVRFYVAEIAEALHYLHGIGLIYRDLKPSNVMIDLNGHVKLADLGGVTDSVGNVLCPDDVEQHNMLYTYTCGVVVPEYKAEHLDKPRKRRSFLGTAGYMAPEVLELLSESKRWAEGYTYMADYWSLGVVVYLMITGTMPFNVPFLTPIGAEISILTTSELVFEEDISDSCTDFIRSLLEVDQTKRLGFGTNGLDNIRKHPFYRQCDSFDWSKVVRKQCKPPIAPSAYIDYSATKNGPKYEGFHTLPIHLKGDVETPTPEEQVYFNDW